MQLLQYFHDYIKLTLHETSKVTWMDCITVTLVYIFHCLRHHDVGNIKIHSQKRHNQKTILSMYSSYLQCYDRDSTHTMLNPNSFRRVTNNLITIFKHLKHKNRNVAAMFTHSVWLIIFNLLVISKMHRRIPIDCGITIHTQHTGARLY